MWIPLTQNSGIFGTPGHLWRGHPLENLGSPSVSPYLLGDCKLCEKDQTYRSKRIQLDTLQECDHPTRCIQYFICNICSSERFIRTVHRKGSFMFNELFIRVLDTEVDTSIHHIYKSTTTRTTTTTTTTFTSGFLLHLSHQFLAIWNQPFECGQMHQTRQPKVQWKFIKGSGSRCQIPLGSDPKNPRDFLGKRSFSLVLKQKPLLVGWFNQPIWKICSSNWIIFPRDRGENK